MFFLLPNASRLPSCLSYPRLPHSAYKAALPSHPRKCNKFMNKTCKTPLLPMPLFVSSFTKLLSHKSPGPLLMRQTPGHFPLDIDLSGLQQGMGACMTGQVWGTPTSFQLCFCVCTRRARGPSSLPASSPPTHPYAYCKAPTLTNFSLVGIS